MATTIHTIERKPENTSANTRSPLLVLLHGYGSNEHDLMGLAPYLDSRFHIVSARAVLTLGPGMYAWYHLSGMPGSLIPDTETRVQSLETLQKFLPQLISQVDADPDHVYLLGFSQGCVMSLSLGLTLPDVVAGVVGISGYLDPDILTKIDPTKFSTLDAITMHGTYDDVIPVAQGQASRDALQQLPFKSYAYHEYPIAHSIHPDGLMLAQNWFAERLNGRAE